VARYGFAWLTHPLVIVLMALMVLVIVYPFLREKPAWSGDGD